MAGLSEGKDPNKCGPSGGFPWFQVAGWHLAMAFGANSKRIFLPEEMDGFRGAPEWLFWGWISRTADKL